MLKCKKCKKVIRNVNSGHKQTYHLECYKIKSARDMEKVRQDKKIWNKISTENKKALIYIGKNLENPTENNIKDLCSYYGADISFIKKNLHLTELAVKSYIKKGISLNNDKYS